MKILMKTLSAGPAGVRKPSDRLDLPQAEAEAMIAGNYAEAIPEPAAKNLAPAPELHHATAPAPEVERAVVPAPAPPAPAVHRRKRN